MRAIDVLVVDDHAVVREGLSLFLGGEDGAFRVVGEARDGMEAVDLAARLRPDVILMDVVMPRMGGIDALVRIREAGIPSRVLMLSTFAAEADVLAALRAGATGYVLKGAGREELLSAVRSAAAGHAALHPDAQTRMVSYLAKPPAPSPLAGLSERERQVLELIGAGHDNRAIADALGLAVGTVKGHVHRLLKKLGVADRTQAALLVERHARARR